ncbi:MAG: lantibiotic dehydratase [Parachlamydiaceae bacterium]
MIKTSKVSLYHAAPFFLVRAPLLPGHHFFDLAREKVSLSLFSEEDQVLIKEALAIASPSFYEAMVKGKIKKAKQEEQIAKTLMKYLLRMCSRSTPFGLFSFVSTGSWKENSCVEFDVTQVCKRARPDMEWVCNLIEKLSSDPDLFLYLPIRTNPLIFNAGDRTHLHYLRKENKEDESLLSSIRSNELTEALFESAKVTTTPIELKDKMISRLFYHHLDPNKVLNMIRELLNQQFLQVTILPSFLSASFFSNLVDNLSSFLQKRQNDLAQRIADPPEDERENQCFKSAYTLTSDSIEEIRSLIESYNNLSPGKGETLFKHLQMKMEEICPAKHYLQIDSFYTGSEVYLSKDVANELESTAEFLWTLSCCRSQLSSLHAYHQKFLDKYGTARTIPLCELMNQNRGLGPPDHYLNDDAISTQKDPSSVEKKWKKWLKRELELCLRKKNQEIEIPAEWMDEMVKEEEKQKAVPSFDLNCEIIADSVAEIDAGNFLLNVHFTSSKGGCVFGRFLDMLGEGTQDKLRIFLRDEEELEPHSAFATLCYSPFPSRLANLNISPNLRTKNLDLVHETDICLEDILVGATSERFYLTLKESSKEWVIAANHMLNRAFAPHAIRFIEDVCDAKYKGVRGFDWQEMKERPFLPRVRFKKTILSPAQWNIDLFELGLSDNALNESIKEKFNDWALLWDLPRYLYLIESDHRLLLDRTCGPHLEHILLQIKKGEKVRLTEKIGQHKGQWIQSQRGVHFSEFTVPFIKNKQYADSVKDAHSAHLRSIAPDFRFKLLGSEWFYVKFYLNASEENELLSKECLAFSQKVLDLGLIVGWFFIRYNDPRSHLRLRFRLKEGASLTSFLPLFHEWSSRLLHQYFIYEMSLASYEREVERYGGEELIEYAESVFCGDCLASIDLFRCWSHEADSHAQELLSALSLIDLLKHLGLSLQEQLSYFSLRQLSQDELPGFRAVKPSLLKYAQAILNNTLEQYSELYFFSQALLKRRGALEDFAKKMRELEAQQLLTSSSHSILGSLIHMHCNRLIGRESQREKKTCVYVFHTLHLLFYDLLAGKKSSTRVAKDL